MAIKTLREQHEKRGEDLPLDTEGLEDLTRLLRKTTLETMLEGEREKPIWGMPNMPPKAITAATATMVTVIKTGEGETRRDRH